MVWFGFSETENSATRPVCCKIIQGMLFRHDRMLMTPLNGVLWSSLQQGWRFGESALYAHWCGPLSPFLGVCCDSIRDLTVLTLYIQQGKGMRGAGKKTASQSLPGANPFCFSPNTSLGPIPPGRAPTLLRTALRLPCRRIAPLPGRSGRDLSQKARICSGTNPHDRCPQRGDVGDFLKRSTGRESCLIIRVVKQSVRRKSWMRLTDSKSLKKAMWVRLRLLAQKCCTASCT